MFRITRNPSSGSFIQCLVKITVIRGPVVRVCTAQCREAHEDVFIIDNISGLFCNAVTEQSEPTVAFPWQY